MDFLKFRINVMGIIQKNDKILLGLNNEKNHPMENKWVFPGGKLQWNETPEEGLKREIKEEICADAKINGLIGVFLTQDKVGIKGSYSCVLYYLCDILDEPKKSDELKEVKWIEIEKIKEYLSENVTSIMPVEIKNYLKLN